MKDFPELSYQYKLKTKIQIRFKDIDRLGHINNVVWQEYFDVARQQYFNEVLKITNFNTEVKFVIVNINNDYFKSLYDDDEIFVETKVYKIGSHSLHFAQKISAMRENKIIEAGIGRAVMACVNNETAHIVPEDVVNRIKAFEAEL